MKHRLAVVVPGGVGRSHFIPSLVQLLDRLSASYSLSIYSFSPDELHPLLAGQGIEHSVPPKWFLRHKILSLIYFYFKIQRDHWVHPFSLLQAFWVIPSGLTVMAVNVLLRLPVVLSLPGGDTVRLPSIHYGGMKSELFRRLIRRCCMSADSVVMLTRFQEAAALMHGVVPAKVRIVPYGVDTAQFSFRPKPLSYPLQLISIGSINRVKNIFLQIDTLALLRREIDCRLTVVGKDIIHGQAHAHAEALNVGHLIQWAGNSAHDEIPSLLHESHVLLHTAWYEAEGVVMMEAFAAGTVVAVVRVGLLAEIDAEGECSVDQYDASALCEKILGLVRNPARFAQIQARNRQHAEHYTIDRTAAEYRKLYEELCCSASAVIHAEAVADYRKGLPG
jgi:glycosyltransferase involved in cell wall biosynthesis